MSGGTLGFDTLTIRTVLHDRESFRYPFPFLAPASFESYEHYLDHAIPIFIGVCCQRSRALRKEGAGQDSRQVNYRTR